MSHHGHRLVTVAIDTSCNLNEASKQISLTLEQRMKLKQLVGAVSLTAASVFSAAAMAALDPSLPTYEKSSGVSGNLSSVGSDTLANMMTLWAEEYKVCCPTYNEIKD